MVVGEALAGKTAIVTGSGRGIGRAIALELARRGAQVAVNFFRRRAPAEETAAAITALGGRAIVVKAHVGRLDGLQTLVQETVSAFGGVDIFIANAASGVLRPAVEQDARTWDWTMNINARSLLFGARAVAPFMQAKGWGRIIGITSIGATRVLPEYAMVGISKAAIEAAVRYLAVELAPAGIVCNAISPGVVETEALDFFPSKDQILVEGLRRTPAGRFVRPDEVARLAAFLCSEDAAMIVGQVITIDGGYANRA